MKSLVTRTLGSDLLSLLLCLGPIVLSLILTALELQQLPSFYLQIVLAPIALPLSFIFTVFVIRLLLPSLKKGVYPVGFNKGFMAWWTHSLLTRSARIFGIHYLLHSIALLRWLYWRALGAKVAYSISTSYKITLHDIALIEIEEGVILAEDTELSGHIVRGDRVLVAPVRIGKNSFIGRGTYIGPRTRIGENCWIGMSNNVTGEILAPNTRIGNHEWAQGNPRKVSERDA